MTDSAGPRTRPILPPARRRTYATATPRPLARGLSAPLVCAVVLAGLACVAALPGAALVLVSDATPPAEPSADALPHSALRTGNRLFRRGDLRGAVEAYRAADPEALAGDPVLAYNLATALHRLGRLPEAVLWYRRAARLLGSDPWLSENLERARAALASPRLGPPPLLAPLLLHPWLLPAGAALAAWAALLVQAASLRRRRAFPSPSRPSRGGRAATAAAAGLLLAGALLWVTHLALPRLGPRPAVLLAPCGDALPAGSEVWARRRAERSSAEGSGARPEAPTAASWSVRGPNGPLVCDGDAVAPL